MSKRKLDSSESDFSSRKSARQDENVKKHSMDSDEEEETDENNVLNDSDIEGEEDGVAYNEGEVRMTAFNMREELEEGHFDQEGHFIWKNEREIKDSWLDNIDWQKISTVQKNKEDSGGLGDDSDTEEPFEEILAYEKMLGYMKPKESVSKSLTRLGGDDKKLSSIERLRRKKAGTLNTNKDVIDLTELANSVLSHTGNMDVYQETYEMISQKLENHNKKKTPIKAKEAELDMYSDDFDMKEKEKLDEAGPSTKTENNPVTNGISWEFKWDQDKDKIEGPYSTEQMLNWSNDGYFKTGVWVRKCGENTNFYTSNRIDFDLYL